MAIEMQYGDAKPAKACYQCLKTGVEMVPFDNQLIPGGRRWICRECHVGYYTVRCKEEDVLQ